MDIYNHKNLFIENKYYKWYYSIIENALIQNRKKINPSNPKYVYYEMHHILPSCMFPEYKSLKKNPWNKVLLTAKEHFVCHLLLPKFVVLDNHRFKTTHALYAMVNQNNSQQKRNNSKMYEYAKTQMIKIRSDPSASLQWRKKLSIASKTSNHMIGKTGDKNPFYGKTHNEKARQKMRDAKLGTTLSEDTKIKMRGKRGKQKNPAQLLECPHCKIITKRGNRWHFDRCSKRAD